MEPDRLLLRPADLTEDQRALYDEICTGPRAHVSRPSGPVDAEGRLNGPFDAMLHAPRVGGPLQRLGAALRHESSLHPARVLEVRTLVGYYTTLAWQLRLFGIDPAEASNG